MNIYIKNDAEIQAIAAEGKVHGIGNILEVFDNRHGLARDFKARKAYYEHKGYPLNDLLEAEAAK